ncbi:DUF192 domain-containing protein [Ahrensia marina]|uniref:DUF192 domain-containing protein n=1 Tax=Ahrensia marina TaxID=1514904 RepID=UPI0035CFB3E4
MLRTAISFVVPMLLAGLFWAGAAWAFEESSLSVETSTGSHQFTIEIARTPQEQGLGLMHRRELAPDFAMLFPFAQAREASFWMRDTYVSLDMVFIAEDGVVHRIERGTEPLSLRSVHSRGPVIAVLEFVAGTADRIGLEPGDTVIHPDLQRQ